MKRVTQRGLGFLVAAVAIVAGATDATAKEAPPVAAACAPPCQPGESCVGGACMVPAARPNVPPPAFPPPPPMGAPPPPAFPPSPPPGAPPPHGAPTVYAPYSGYRPLPPPPPGPPIGFYDAPARPVRPRRFMALPYIGTQSYQSEVTRAYFPGFRIGTLIGGRVNEQLSLNWELTFDISNIDEPTGSPSSSEFAFDFAFSPLVHFPAGAVEFLLGPKLGVFWVSTDIHDTSTYVSQSHQGTGILGGITAGTFMPVSTNVSLGVLLSGELRKIEHACTVNVDEIALCDLARDNSAAVVGLTAAALFR